MKHAALLRGINVGTAKRVAMAELRALVEGLGYGEVRTLLNSGNVVFEAPQGAAESAGARIEKALAETLKVQAKVLVVSAPELAEVVEQNPLPERAGEPSRLMVAFLATAGHAALLEPLGAQEWAPECLLLGRRVAYLWCPAGVIESRLAPAVGKLLKDAVTVRNWATVLKLRALMEG